MTAESLRNPSSQAARTLAEFSWRKPRSRRKKLVSQRTSAAYCAKPPGCWLTGVLVWFPAKEIIIPRVRTASGLTAVDCADGFERVRLLHPLNELLAACDARCHHTLNCKMFEITIQMSLLISQMQIKNTSTLWKFFREYVSLEANAQFI